MAVRPTKQQLCIVTIGYQRLLLPQAQALKLYDLASQAMVVEFDFDAPGRSKYRVGEPLEVEMAAVRAEQLIMPDATATPVSSGRRKPLLLR